MTVEQILKLGAMGYTKDDIEKMIETPAEPIETLVEAPKPVEPTTIDQPVEKNHDLVDMFDKYLKGMQDTLKEIQSANIRSSQMPEAPDAVGDALASIITPKKK